MTNLTKFMTARTDFYDAVAAGDNIDIYAAMIKFCDTGTEILKTLKIDETVINKEIKEARRVTFEKLENT